MGYQLQREREQISIRVLFDLPEHLSSRSPTRDAEIATGITCNATLIYREVVF